MSGEKVATWIVSGCALALVVSMTAYAVAWLWGWV